jgi:hypothetical protein
MLGRILSLARSAAHNANSPVPRAPRGDRVSAENVRALATGAALAVALDASPAVLVSIYEYAHRFREHRPRRLAY